MSVSLQRMKTTVGGVSIEYFEAGKGPPLLYLHGGEGPGTYSTRHLEELAGDYHVIAPWHPGFGSAELPRDFDEVADIAYLYFDFICKLALTDAVLIGSSFGGWVALEMAIRSPQQFSNLVLISPLGVKLGGREQRDFLDLFLVHAVDWPSYYIRSAELLPNYDSLASEELIGIARSREAIARFGFEPYLHRPGLKRWLHRITIPSLVLSGADDRIVSPTHGESLAGLLPNCRFERVQAAGHLIEVDQPKLFAGLVKQFLDPAATSPDCGHERQGINQ